MIDMDIETDKTFFTQSNLSYQEITESKNPIGLITDYFKSQGKRAWWLAESSPAEIRMFNELSAQEQKEMIGYCFVHFPEIFSSSKKKYHRAALWLTMKQSVISTSLRDNFSASGKVDVVLKNRTYSQLSRIYETLHNHRSIVRKILSETSIEELLNDWNVIEKLPQVEMNQVLNLWIFQVANIADHKHGTEEGIRTMLQEIVMDQ